MKVNARLPWIYALPMIVFVVGIFAYPIATLFRYSLQTVATGPNGISTFAGLDNFRYVFADPLFRTAILNNLKLFLCVPVMVVLYDGVPRTKHVITNVTVEVATDRATAAARSYFTVLQALPDLPLQPIIAGRYHDRFARDAGGWYFSEREIIVDLTGDLSRHYPARAG